MLDLPGGPVEAPLRRQSDTHIDSGLDYSTCFRIKQGTPIHGRFFSRSNRALYPSHTPWPLDETSSRDLEGFDAARSFDFHTAKSVANFALLNSATFSLPSRLVPAVPYVPDMLSVSRRKKHARTHTSTRISRTPYASLDGVDGGEESLAIDNALIHETSLTCCPPCLHSKRSDMTLAWQEMALYPGINTSYNTNASAQSSSMFTHRTKVTDVRVDHVHPISISERRSSLPGQGIRSARSRSSLRSKSRAPSLETIALKNSGNRHTLLKPSAIAGHLIDMGLPVQPVLINTPSTLPDSSQKEAYNNALAGHNHSHSQVTPVEALSSLLELAQSKEQVTYGKCSKTPEQTTETNAVNSLHSPARKPISKVPAGGAVRPIVYGEIPSVAKGSSYKPGTPRTSDPASLFESAPGVEEYLKRNCPVSKEISTRKGAEIDAIHENTGRVLSVASTTNSNLPNEIASDNVPSSENMSPEELHEKKEYVQEAQKAAKVSKPKEWKTVSGKHSSTNLSVTHATIPPRMSSLENGASISQKNFRKIPNRNNSPNQVVLKHNGRVQSTSSTTSSRISSSIVPHSQLLGNDRDENRLFEVYDSNVGLQLLRELLYGNEPYTTRLTEIPQRKYRLPRIAMEPTQRSTSPNEITVIAEKYLKESKPRLSQTFTRTINDLENLMSEALQIARQVAEKQGVEEQSKLHDPKTQHDVVKQRTYNRGHLDSIICSRLSDMLSHQESVHESAFSASSCSLSLYGDNIEPYEKIYPPLPCAVTCQSDGDVVVVQHITTEMPNIRDVNKGLLAYVQNEGLPENSLRENHQYSHAEFVKLERIKRDEEMSRTIRKPYEEDIRTRIKIKRQTKAILNKREVTEFIKVFHQPPIQSRHSSLALRKAAKPNDSHAVTTSALELAPNISSGEVLSLRSRKSSSHHNFDNSQVTGSEVEFENPPGFRKHASPHGVGPSNRTYELKDFNEGGEQIPKRHISGRRLQEKFRHLKHDNFSHLNLRHRSHISLRDHKGFSLSRSHRRQPIARDWSPGRKRFAATVACISTALIGILIGIYAGEVPSIQYYIADFYHYAILGNVFFFITLAMTTLLSWPLPLLHGRKPYTLAALSIAMPLLFPQAIAVGIQRSPYDATWRVALLLPRTIMGAALGFANINFMATLTDLFGASLQSSNPHQEIVDELDVRRHGGGLGVWLGIWTWCYVGSIGVGFLIGAVVINTLSPDWGFYVSIVIIAAVLLLNVVTPEVRRSPYRRSVMEVRNGKNVSHRLARGEVMMHRIQTGPKWWGEEFHHGLMLSLDMLHQPGFLVMSLYVAWMYGQIVLVIVLLGSLMSKYYHFASPAVGATTMAIPLGALLAVPFQKASLFSRARRRPQRTDSMTFDTKVTFSSHLVRRAIFTIVLPFASLAYTLSSSGPPTPFILPVLFAGLIGFLSNLAIAECNGILMETFDTSDLQPGMTGRPRGSSGDRTKHKRTNYSSFPRVSSAFAIVQALGFLIAAAATGVGGVAERHIGQQAATGVMAGILLILTVGFLGVLYRFKEVEIIPTHNEEDMVRWEEERKMSFRRQKEATRQGAPDDPIPDIEEPWRPTIIGNPSGKTRRMSILELGHLSRWSEIRRKNKMIDEMSYEARHPNLATLEDVRREIRDKNLGSLRRGASQRSRRSQLSQGSEEPYVDSEDLGERNKST